MSALFSCLIHKSFPFMIVWIQKIWYVMFDPEYDDDSILFLYFVAIAGNNLIILLSAICTVEYDTPLGPFKTPFSIDILDIDLPVAYQTIDNINNRY